MSSGTECAICCSEYTTDGDHRIISLKCGHIFGKECIEKWIIESRNRICPTCSVKTNRSQMRPIFVDGIETIDNKKEAEILEKFRAEQQKATELQRVIGSLKVEVEALKIIIKENQKKLKKEKRIHTNLKMNIENKFTTHTSKMLVDNLSFSLIISCKHLGHYGLFMNSILNESIHHWIKTEGRVVDFDVSTFNDGLCCYIVDKKFSLIRLDSQAHLFDLEFSEVPSVLKFNTHSRNEIFVGFVSGAVKIVNISDKSTISAGVISSAIQSIEITKRRVFNNNKFFWRTVLFLTSPFEVYELEVMNDEDESKRPANQTEDCESEEDDEGGCSGGPGCECRNFSHRMGPRYFQTGFGHPGFYPGADYSEEYSDYDEDLYDEEETYDEDEDYTDEGDEESVYQGFDSDYTTSEDYTTETSNTEARAAEEERIHEIRGLIAESLNSRRLTFDDEGNLLLDQMAQSNEPMGPGGLTYDQMERAAREQFDSEGSTTDVLHMIERDQEQEEEDSLLREMVANEIRRRNNIIAGDIAQRIVITENEGETSGVDNPVVLGPVSSDPLYVLRKVDMRIEGVITGSSSFNDTIMVTTRHTDNVVTLGFKGNTERVIITEIVQKTKLNNKLLKNNIVVVNNKLKCLVIFRRKDFSIVDKLFVDDDIVDYVMTDKVTVIVTTNKLYFYHDE